MNYELRITNYELRIMNYELGNKKVKYIFASLLDSEFLIH